MRWLLSFLILGLLSVVQAVSSSGNRLLVVLEELAEKSKYSKYIADLEGRGFSITFESPKSDKVALFELGERAYDHVLLLPTKAKGLGPALTPKLLLDFINAGGNILLTLSSSTSTPTSLVSLLLELDIHLPSDRKALVIDHFNYDTLSASEKHDVVLVPRPDAIRPDIKNFFRGEGKGGEVIAFPRGVGQELGNASPLLTPILRAPRTAYSYNPKDDVEGVEDPFGVGSQLSLITTMQARNSARFTVIGSSEMLEDAWFDAKVKRSVGLGGVGSDAKNVKTANQAFAREVTAWTFNEIGVLKVGKIEHSLNEGGVKSNITNPKIYRVKNDVTYSIEISEYSWDKWVPFTPPTGDVVQLEFSMLSPFHRLPLTPSTTTKDSTIYTTSFQLPDQHGIFNFKVNYKRPFLSNLEEKNTVTVRHFAHDEYTRSWGISGAWPWIAGIGATVSGWVVFVAIWLWSKPVPLKLTTSGKKVQ
ncbi:dolichyl-diphosphooligosaccharide--protein glycosyltransferase-like protein 48 kDa subunit [Mollisia scopiformis]|uniref:Dolichyl-diphosphooligosaccharide--protein glycosyltransferase subunit WBP1 n=1 Tax=Mollisia scopiformis TaxID=149040 RepID=A0A132BBM1_MOLSC|nr:dolichyl-diphosphooligosaccharide--protein glycosyltransferase-like protein 48 kDa subunit [Mollisia scopiformis]KUJ09781.1 dolichyl-diphosphooligosaccharide--protein glycosyltransferas-like protein 48 kDa subunit [Mollisia scopiformis]